MHIGLNLDDREREDRRKIFETKVATGKWYACVASADLRYFVPIITSSGRYCHSLPTEFRRLGIKHKMRKFFSSCRVEAENIILRAAATRGEDPLLLTIFGPKEKSWQRTRNLFDQPQAGPLNVQLKKFIPQQFGWRRLVQKVISSDLTAAMKIILLYAYERGFNSGEFFASSATAATDTRLSLRSSELSQNWSRRGISNGSGPAKTASSDTRFSTPPRN